MGAGGGREKKKRMRRRRRRRSTTEGGSARVWAIVQRPGSVRLCSGALVEGRAEEKEEERGEPGRRWALGSRPC